MKNTFFALCMLFFQAASAQRVPSEMPHEPGKCFAKCIIPDQYESTSLEIPVYTGSKFDHPLVEKMELSIGGSSHWVKKTQDGREAYCLVPGSDSVTAVWQVKDTALLKDFKMTRFVTGRKLVKSGGYVEWREVLCGEKIQTGTLSQIWEALRGFGYEVGWSTDPKKLDNQTKKALADFQKDRGLPVGNLDFETLAALGVRY